MAAKTRSFSCNSAAYFSLACRNSSSTCCKCDRCLSDFSIARWYLEVISVFNSAGVLAISSDTSCQIALAFSTWWDAFFSSIVRRLASSNVQACVTFSSRILGALIASSMADKRSLIIRVTFLSLLRTCFNKRSRVLRFLILSRAIWRSS